MNLDTVRTEIASALGSISGLRTFAYTPSSLEPPSAVVGQGAIDYDATFAGSMTAEFGILVVVSRADDRNGHSRLNEYLAPTGSGSIKAAIESDPTLNGSVGYVTVTGANPPSEVEMANTSYLAVEFTCEAGD